MYFLNKLLRVSFWSETNVYFVDGPVSLVHFFDWVGSYGVFLTGVVSFLVGFL